MLRKIFVPKRDKVTGEWRKLHNEELNDPYFSTNILVIKSRMRWARHIASIRDRRGAYRVLVGKPEGKRPLGKPRHRQEDITLDCQKVGWGAWTGFMWLRKGQVAGSCDGGSESSGSIKCREFLD
jgi:hypothetical protein